MAILAMQSLLTTSKQIEIGEISPVELTLEMLQRIAKRDGDFHCYVTILADSALDQARTARNEIANGRYRGPLHGIPIAIKDLFFTEGAPTSCGSAMMANWIPDQDLTSGYANPPTATVVHKLTDAGAILLGKLHLTEFAMRWHHPYRPIPVNPWGEGLWPGVSSSGSGVATAAGLCFGALGSDTGGSIRFPAAACGIVGLKQTYGRVSRAGVFPLAASLDNVGPLARTVADAAAMLGAIAGHDPLDPTTSARPVPDYLAGIDDGVADVRLGIDERFIHENADAEVTVAIMKAVTLLRELGAEIVPLQMPDMAEVEEAWYTICSVEATVAHRGIYPERADEYGPFLEWMESGLAQSAQAYAEAHAVREMFSTQLLTLFDRCEVIACPLLPSATPMMDNAGLPIMGEKGTSSRFFSYPFSFSRNPALVLPCGLSDENRPITLQLIGAHFDEARLCRVGHTYERATEWHKLIPPLV